MKKVLETIWFQPYTPLIVIVLILLGFARFVYPPIQKAIQGTKVEVPLPSPFVSPTPSVLANTAALLEKIGTHIMLPSNETPQVIPITNIEQFKNQPFFRHAKNGDVLLLYTQNKKAILYNPEEDKIIDTAPIGETSEQTQGQNREQPTPTATPGLTSHPTTTSQPSPTPTGSPTPTPTKSENQ